jgi:hypothetical protein
MSYDGEVDFGLVGDFDAMADLDSFGLDLEAAIEELVGTLPPGARDGTAQRTSRARARNGAMSVK